MSNQDDFHPAPQPPAREAPPSAPAGNAGKTVPATGGSESSAPGSATGSPSTGNWQSETFGRNGFPPGRRLRDPGRLGEGGMGVVWKALQHGTHRTVALKLMNVANFGSQRAEQRFQREVDLTARLEHPNIARVYDGGHRHGIYFYAMELIDGRPLDRYVKDAGLSQGESWS